MNSYTTRSIDYEARRGDGGDVEIVVRIEGIQFVREVIPDGSMAGMMGHREVPYEGETVLNLHPEQARRLRDQLDEILPRK